MDRWRGDRRSRRHHLLAASAGPSVHVRHRLRLVVRIVAVDARWQRASSALPRTASCQVGSRVTCRAMPTIARHAPASSADGCGAHRLGQGCDLPVPFVERCGQAPLDGGEASVRSALPGRHAPPAHHGAQQRRPRATQRALPPLPRSRPARPAAGPGPCLPPLATRQQRSRRPRTRPAVGSQPPGAPAAGGVPAEIHVLRRSTDDRR